MTAHPQLTAYLQRNGLPVDRVRPDGRLSLALGDRARMLLQPLPGGGLLFEGRVAPLPPPGRQRGERIDTLLRAGAARLRGHAQALVIDAEAEAFVLQQRVGEGLAPVAFDAAVEGFLKALVFWKCVEAAQ
jgi:hypothetical protein